MFTTNNKDTSSAPAKQPEQKAAKEKTMATAPVTSVAEIDVTKPLTQEEMALVSLSREQDAAQQVNGDPNNLQTTKAPTTVTNDTSNLEAYEAYRNKLIASEKEGGAIDAETKVAESLNPETNPILPTTKKEEIEPEKVVETAPEISSTVGDFATKKDKLANLGVDVAFVQGHLLRLGILSQEDFDAEKITTAEAVEKTTIPKTIAAIRNFQIDVLGYGGDGYASPGGGTITNLINLTPEQLQIKKTKIAEAKTLAEAEAKAKEEAKQKAIKDEQDRKLQEEVKIRLSAQRVHDGIYGAGTDEQKVYLALARLNNDDKQIARFKKVYAELYNADVISDIEGDFSFGEEDKALAYLNIGGVAQNDKNKKDKSKEFKTVEPIVSKDNFRSQSKDALTGVKDSEYGPTNCKLVAEKMVYRQLYDDLDAEFKGTDVTKEATGKYKHIVGNVGAGEFISVLKEDKSEYKNIDEGVHKQSTFNAADSQAQALDYLDEYLDEGIAVVVGVDHTFNRTLEKGTPKTTSKNTPGYNEGTTDHFIVVVGKGVTEDGKKYYQFYDPGTSKKATGTKDSNKLIENDTGDFSAKQPWNKNRSYHLTMVLLFKKDTETYKENITRNNSEREQLKDSYDKRTGHFKTN